MADSGKPVGIEFLSSNTQDFIEVSWLLCEAGIVMIPEL